MHDCETGPRRMTLSLTILRVALAGFSAPPLISTSLAAAPPDAVSPEDEPDDRLPRKTEQLVTALVERGMPELVEAAVAGRPTMFRAPIARAWVQAGLSARTAAQRERFFQQAATVYRTVIELENDRAWFVGERRRLRTAQWRVEFADLILRYWIAPDLDRFEITSGLACDRRRIADHLEDALAQYDDALALLDDLDERKGEDEDPYLLLGIAGKIDEMSHRCRLNRAWAALYAAMIGSRETRDHDQRLASALHAFDVVARNATDPTRKYNAMLGTGMALREMKRFDEAEAVLDRVRDSTAPAALTARARYEKARTLLSANQFNAARRELAALAARAQREPQDRASDATFYVRLAAVIRAYTDVLEAGTDEASDHARELRRSARRAFAHIADRGGPWSDVARVYLDALAGGHRGVEDLTAVELRNMARKRMARHRYAEAASALQVLLDREDDESPDQRPEARFNLAVCRFQLGDVRSAAEAFLALARMQPSTDATRQSAAHAFRCWRQLALKSKDPADARRLSEAANILSQRSPKHPLAKEAPWTAAAAMEEAGDLTGAREAYLNVPPSSKRYWPARRGAIRCLQRSCDAMPTTRAATQPDRATAVRRASQAWRTFADQLQATSPRPEGIDAPAWIAEARLSAATLLASDVLKNYDDCLKLLTGLPADRRVLALQIRCQRGKGDLKQAIAVLGRFLELSPGPEAGGVLLGLAAEMEGEVARLRSAGRETEAARAAAETVEIIQALDEWVHTQPDTKQGEAVRRHAGVVRISLVRALIQAGQHDEALRLLDKAMAEAPDDGNLIRYAARFQEQAAESGAPAKRGAAADRAEALWARLLADAGLREHTPEVYWEARFHWLRHQLRHGHAAEVVRGIETEQAWYPDLGGPPWQARLLELATKARAAAERATP